MDMTKLPSEVNVPIELVERHDIDHREWVGKQVLEGKYSRLIDHPVILREHGVVPKTTIVCLDLKEYGVDLSHLVTFLQKIHYSSLNRVAGTAAISAARQRVFGYMPKKTGHRDYCTAASLAWDEPDTQGALEDAARVAEHFYRITNPELYRLHRAKLERHWKDGELVGVGDDWRLQEGSSVFTSGIINKNNPLPYHYDTGNYENVWSAMYVFKSPGYSGGRLHCPEYDCAFDLPDHSLLMFDGQGLVHGVTPVVNEGGAYRFSVVYYSLRMMWQCLTSVEEVDRARDIKYAREVLRDREDQAREEEDPRKRAKLLEQVEEDRLWLKSLLRADEEEQLVGGAKEKLLSTEDDRGEGLW